MAQEAKVTLQSSDDELFEVNEPVAFESQTIKNIVEDIGTATAIPLPHVSGKMLFKVIEYCKFHVEAQNLADDEIKTWDEEFVKVDTATLFDLFMAAHYLNIKKLLDLTCHTMVNMMNG